MQYFANIINIINEQHGWVLIFVKLQDKYFDFVSDYQPYYTTQYTYI